MDRAFQKRVWTYANIRAVWLGPSLSANRIIGYYRMYVRKAKVRMIFTYAQDDMNLRTFRMFKGTFSLDAVQVMFKTPQLVINRL